MNYRQTLDYLFSRLPMFHRIGAAAYKADLGNTIFLCKVLGNPEKLFPSVHVAGTNGKGSVSHMTASILQEAGYKTGLYTSPHLKDFRERIRINGKKIPKPKVTGFVKTNKSSFEPVQPSFFEYTFGMAIKYFADEETDVAVMETGMGGRLDSTNVVNSIVSVITNIGLDHTQFLGTTLEKIALEKAGIIKPGIPVVIGESQRETDDIFIRTAAENHSPVYFADSVYRVGENIWRQDINFSIMLDVLRRNKVFLKNLECPLPGNYQLKNIITVCQTIEVLSSLGYQIKPDHIFAGIKNVVRNTGFSGRWQILGKNPLIICDTGHNLDGITEVVKQLKETSFKKLHFVIGFVADKNIDSMITLLPVEAEYYFCKADIPRGLDQNELKQKCQEIGLTGKSYSSVRHAFESAKNNAKAGDLIFVGGSTFVVAEVL